MSTATQRAKIKTAWCRATGELIAAARSAAGMTQAEVANAIGVDRQTIYRWEAGAQPPDSFMLARACAAMGCRVDLVLAPGIAS